MSELTHAAVPVTQQMQLLLAPRTGVHKRTCQAGPDCRKVFAGLVAYASVLITKRGRMPCCAQVLDCVNDPVCKAGLDCLQACSFNDQVTGLHSQGNRLLQCSSCRFYNSALSVISTHTCVIMCARHKKYRLTLLSVLPRSAAQQLLPPPHSPTPTPHTCVDRCASTAAS